MTDHESPPDPRPVFEALLRRYRDKATFDRGMEIVREGRARGLLGRADPPGLDLIAISLVNNGVSALAMRWICAHLKACEPQTIAAMEREADPTPHRLFLLVLEEAARGPIAQGEPS